MSELACSELSLAAGEPLAGTAVSHTDRWLVLQHTYAWGPKGVDDSGLPERVVQALSALGKRQPRLRVQLVRRPGQHEPPASTQLYCANTGETERALWSLELDAIDDLAALAAGALEPLLRGECEPPGVRERDPLYLVCVHGKRDRCCARLGLPVQSAFGRPRISAAIVLRRRCSRCPTASRMAASKRTRPRR